MRPVPSRALSRAEPFFQTAARIHRAVMESTKPDVQRKTDYQNQADIRIHDFSPKAKMTVAVIPALTRGAR